MGAFGNQGFLGGAFTDGSGNYSFKVAQGASGEVFVDTFGGPYAMPANQPFNNIQADTVFNFTLTPAPPPPPPPQPHP